MNGWLFQGQVGSLGLGQRPWLNFWLASLPALSGGLPPWQPLLSRVRAETQGLGGATTCSSLNPAATPSPGLYASELEGRVLRCRGKKGWWEPGPQGQAEAFGHPCPGGVPTSWHVSKASG